MRTCYLLSLALSLGYLVSSGQAQPPPADARQLFVLEDGSSIRHLGGGSWAEYNAGGGLRRQLREVNRGGQFIELTTNVPQPLTIRLFPRTSQYRLHAPGGAWLQWKNGAWRDPR